MRKGLCIGPRVEGRDVADGRLCSAPLVPELAQERLISNCLLIPSCSAASVKRELLAEGSARVGSAARIRLYISCDACSVSQTAVKYAAVASLDSRRLI
jgi:hypothetical protein